MIKPRLVWLGSLAAWVSLACGPSSMRRQSSTFGDVDLGVPEPDAAPSSLAPVDASPDTSSADRAPAIPAGLVLYWKLDEESGLTAEDSSGHGLHGSYVSATTAPAPSTDVPPVEFPFDNPRSRVFTRGARQAVQLAGMPPAIKPATTVSVALWYRSSTLDVGGTTNSPASDVISAGDVYLLRLRPTEVEVSKRVGGTGSAGWVRCRGRVANPVDGRWHHLAAVIDVQVTKLFFDGLEICALANAQPMVYDRGPDLWVGRHGDQQTVYEFDGNVDEVRVYDRALAAPEVAALATGAL